MIKLELDMPPLVFHASNEHAAVEKATEVVLRSVISRTRQGQGYRGRLPRPTDGGPPMVETGTLINSFGMRVVLSKSGTPTGIISPTGPRPEHEQEKIASAKQSARRTTRVMRSYALQHTSIGRLKGKERARALSSIRVRTVTDNASLAAILSTQDWKRAKRRVVYPVFQMTEEEARDAAAVVRQILEVEL